MIAVSAGYLGVGCADRPQLQRQIRDRAQKCQSSNQCGNASAFAEATADEVGNRRGAVCFDGSNQTGKELVREQIDKDRTQIDRQVVPSIGGRAAVATRPGTAAQTPACFSPPSRSSPAGRWRTVSAIPAPPAWPYIGVSAYAGKTNGRAAAAMTPTAADVRRFMPPISSTIYVNSASLARTGLRAGNGSETSDFTGFGGDIDRGLRIGGGPRLFGRRNRPAYRRIPCYRTGQRNIIDSLLHLDYRQRVVAPFFTQI